MPKNFIIGRFFAKKIKNIRIHHANIKICKQYFYLFLKHVFTIRLSITVTARLSITVTAISYMLLRRGFFKADAWMKIAVFGVTFLGFIVSAQLSGLQMLCVTILLLLPIVLSVMVLFSECQCQGSECRKEDAKIEEKEETKEIAESEVTTETAKEEKIEK